MKKINHTHVQYHVASRGVSTSIFLCANPYLNRFLFYSLITKPSYSLLSRQVVIAAAALGYSSNWSVFHPVNPTSLLKRSILFPLLYPAGLPRIEDNANPELLLHAACLGNCHANVPCSMYLHATIDLARLSCTMLPMKRSAFILLAHRFTLALLTRWTTRILSRFRTFPNASSFLQLHDYFYRVSTLMFIPLRRDPVTRRGCIWWLSAPACHLMYNR
jgi:hypothetical protein